jgi:pyridoxine 5-phosphate synthase
VRAAVLAELGGADGITVHLREDRRHIQDRDVRLLIETARTPINLELAAASDVLALAESWRPWQATLVPERREELTTEGGLTFTEGTLGALGGAVERLRGAGIRTALFIDPEPDAVRAARDLGADAVELHTGEYAHAWPRGHAEHAARLRRASALARSLGLDVHAGHGLTYENVAPVAAIEEVEELNIGHAIVSRAVLVGMERAVREMSEILRRARGG